MIKPGPPSSVAKLLLTAVCAFAAGCHFNTVRTNQERDKEDAKHVTDRFYTLLRKDNYADIHELFSPRFFAVTDTGKLDNILIASLEKLGPVTHRELGHWETRVVSGTDAQSQYVLQYAVERGKFPAKETFTLMNEGDDIRIVGYNVTSDGFFQPEGGRRDSSNRPAQAKTAL